MSRRVSKTSNRTRLDANKALAGLPRERIALSERDSLTVIDLLENPPEPNARLIRAAELLRKRAPGRRPLTD